VAVHRQRRPPLLGWPVEQNRPDLDPNQKVATTPPEIRSDEPRLERRIPVLDHFVASIKNGLQPEPSVADNRRTLPTVFGAIRSAEEKREIVLG
jgi:hypothetical protein